ncbi:shikimate dehydrogenase [Spirochaeta cellobiosiphila]|uniref:shikimate dehydrogenase n=1 Tax=Spirochaeta cellobiosiphila TaxID=504483 RepID=UPI000426609C|nr:shikimate dehydrogenase [Spirochaeta cellobiosiphila]
MSKVCLTLTGKSIEENNKLIESYRSYIDMAELRIDLLNEYNKTEILDFASKIGLELILTYRQKRDGGAWAGEESIRRSRLFELLEYPWAYVDLEEDCHWPEGERKINSNGSKIIRSIHDFNGLPKDWVERLKHLDADIVKGAFYPKSYKELARFYQEAKLLDNRCKILLAMGDIGFSTRILAERLGSLLTFASGGKTLGAPGQINPQILCDVYNFKSLNGDEVINGIIGNPVMHSQSPVIHNEAYRVEERRAIYIPFFVEDIKDFWFFAKEMRINGLSVTIPFKETIMKEVHSLDLQEDVKAIGACNTLFSNSDGEKWSCRNTDWAGFLSPLLEEIQNLRGTKVAVIGAGGAAKAIIYALKKEGANICIFNRTISKAKQLADQFDCHWSPLSEDEYDKLEEYGSIIIQTTSVGMHPWEQETPIPHYSYKDIQIAYDIIYVPEQTIFLKNAVKHGGTIINGYKMLVEQAREQHQLFMG